MLIINSEPSAKESFSVPKLSSSFWVTNLNVRLAVFPNKLFILSGLSKPGSSTSILSFPLLRILGSFVPISSTLLLTISIAWSCDEDFNWTSPYSENSRVILLEDETLVSFTLNSCVLNLWK